MRTATLGISRFRISYFIALSWLSCCFEGGFSRLETVRKNLCLSSRERSNFTLHWINCEPWTRGCWAAADKRAGGTLVKG
ncbi:hypothetical protein QE152_g19713 [Popillia japonica]|uniref:Secreted protein n=1 Tax=Popillia japonica TaxID=7064 RepID=A0AAW1KNA6_POPJA